MKYPIEEGRSPLGDHVRTTPVAWATIDSFAGNSTSAALAAERPCPVCGATRWQTVVPFRDFQFYSDSDRAPKRHNFDVCQCRACLALFANPCFTPYGFGVLFEEAGQSYGASPGRFDEQIDWLGKRGLLKDGATLLDVGCSDGGFVRRLPAGMLGIGVDIDQPSIDRALAARNGANAEFYAADFEQFEIGQKVDVITMFHVLEHLPSPRVVLEHLASMSSSDTRLLVEVPILERGSTNDINGFFSVQHLTHFSRASLENLMGTSGWRVIETQIQPDYNGCRVIAVPGSGGAVTPGAGDRCELYRSMKSWYEAMEAVETRIAAVDGPGPIAIWGGGLHLEFLYQFTSLFRDLARRYVVLDSDPNKQGKTWRGLPIMSPELVGSLDWSSVRLLVSTYGSQAEVVEAARARGVPEAAIVTLYTSIRRY
jgi:hypothetical protein